MKIMGKSKVIVRQTCSVTVLLIIIGFWPAVAGDRPNADTTPEIQPIAAIRIFDQYGRQIPGGKRDVGGQIFDVIVGPQANELTFLPDTVNIRVGDTVRWTWASDRHSVTSGDNCSAPDGRFCSPNNMNCEAGTLNDTGFVYEFTFTQSGIYHYFCALHCFAGMTVVVNVRSFPVPRPRPTPVPRPTL